MARVINCPKSIAKGNVAVEGWKAEKCPGRHKIKSGQNGVSLVIHFMQAFTFLYILDY